MNQPLDLGREARLATGFELRRVAERDGLVEFRGYASVAGVPYAVAGGPEFGGWNETMGKGAFKRTLTLGENRALLYAHDNSRVLATTRAGTLSLSEDSVGLHVAAQLNTRVAWVADLVAQIDDGTVDEMSIGFYSLDSKWSKDYSERTVNQVRLVETTIVWAGANGATLATIERARNTVCEARSRGGVDRVAIAARAAAASLRIK
jgi:HK97 family phage prohead protease